MKLYDRLNNNDSMFYVSNDNLLFILIRVTDEKEKNKRLYLCIYKKDHLNIIKEPRLFVE